MSPVLTPILPLLILVVSLIIIQVGTMALMLTGLSREAARFQAYSVFTGVGFTTEEAELVMHHPVRRHIVMALMILGKIGVATGMATLMVAILQTELAEGSGWTVPLLILTGGVVLIWLMVSSPWVERMLNRLIIIALKRFTTLNVRDYVALLRLEGDFTVSEMEVQPNDWVSGKTLVELALAREGLLVLGIRRHDGEYIGAPSGKTQINNGDVVVLYGSAKRIAELDTRGKGGDGDQAHREASFWYDNYLMEKEYERLFQNQAEEKEAKEETAEPAGHDADNPR